MELVEALQSRKSVRRFLPTAVPLDTVKAILELAGTAPSGNNIQPWRSYVVAGQAKNALCSDIMAAVEKDPEANQPEYDYYPPEYFEPFLSRRRTTGQALYDSMGIKRDDKERRLEQMNRNYLFFDAPVGILVTMDRRHATGSWLDIGMYLQNILLAAREFGLHTCGQAAFAWFHQIVRQQLSVPEQEMVVCAIALGYEDCDAPENNYRTGRESVDTLCQFYGFG
ncbi:MAG: nitroreductase [Gammaproteobacteria bacterium]|nr:MAG: nitroreductase [Gammaproteobacteria bacterium]HDY81417.1 nitroreductase [Halieaceae bacterium]